MYMCVLCTYYVIHVCIYAAEEPLYKRAKIDNASLASASTSQPFSPPTPTTNNIPCFPLGKFQNTSTLHIHVKHNDFPQRLQASCSMAHSLALEMTFQSSVGALHACQLIAVWNIYPSLCTSLCFRG